MPYVAGKLALARGDRATALEQFQYAEATMPFWYGPLLKRARDQVMALGGKPLEVTPQAFASTPIVIPQLSVTPGATPTPTLQPTISNYALTQAPPLASTPVPLTSGIGTITLQAAAYPMYHFQPPSQLTFKRVVSLTFRLTSATEIGTPMLRLDPLAPVPGAWRVLTTQVTQLHWGDNPIVSPEAVVLPGGDIYAGLMNYGITAVSITNAGFILVVENNDGTQATYGLQP